MGVQKFVCWDSGCGYGFTSAVLAEAAWPHSAIAWAGFVAPADKGAAEIASAEELPKQGGAITAELAMAPANIHIEVTTPAPPAAPPTEPPSTPQAAALPPVEPTTAEQTPTEQQADTEEAAEDEAAAREAAAKKAAAERNAGRIVLTCTKNHENVFVLPLSYTGAVIHGERPAPSDTFWLGTVAQFTPDKSMATLLAQARWLGGLRW